MTLAFAVAGTISPYTGWKFWYLSPSGERIRLAVIFLTRSRADGILVGIWIYHVTRKSQQSLSVLRRKPEKLETYWNSDSERGLAGNVLPNCIPQHQCFMKRGGLCKGKYKIWIQSCDIAN
jgi:hypothetical protein